MKDHLLTTTAAPPAWPATSPRPDLSNLPANVDRKVGAELVTRYYFPTSPRSLERWPVPVVVVNGKAIGSTAAYFAHAQSLLDAALARSRHTVRSVAA
jgi:hypothetical protein